MADALASGASVRKDVGVQVPHPHKLKFKNLRLKLFFYTFASVYFCDVICETAVYHECLPKSQRFIFSVDF